MSSVEGSQYEPAKRARACRGFLPRYLGSWKSSGVSTSPCHCRGRRVVVSVPGVLGTRSHEQRRGVRVSEERWRSRRAARRSSSYVLHHDARRLHRACRATAECTGRIHDEAISDLVSTRVHKLHINAMVRLSGSCGNAISDVSDITDARPPHTIGTNGYG